MPKKLETWQIWHAFKKHLGEPFLMKVIGKRNARTIRMYAQDPRVTDDRCKDPLQALHIIFSEADAIGRGDVARKAIAYLVTAIEEDSVQQPVQSTLPTIAEELLADFTVVTELKASIERKDHPDMVADYVLAAKEEIDRTHSKYLEDLG